MSFFLKCISSVACVQTYHTLLDRVNGQYLRIRERGGEREVVFSMTANSVKRAAKGSFEEAIKLNRRSNPSRSQVVPARTSINGIRVLYERTMYRAKCILVLGTRFAIVSSKYET